MAAIDSEQCTPSQSKENFNKLFTPKDTLNQPTDVVLVVKDGKQFNAHRKVLSEASPFFEKLLNSDMKESKEGIVRLEMFNESVIAATLEFIYTGHVQILTEDNARDLIVVADYLLLQKLKALAEGVLSQKLNISNCILTRYFSERYQCDELLSKSKKFILANFTALYAANREDVLNISRKEVEMWISSDEIDVNAEEDVFKMILAWIDHDKSKRKKYFAELFRHVRLLYVSRDFLSSDVVTNELVKENEDCLDLVKDAMSSGCYDCKNCDDDDVFVPARKSLETPAIVMANRAADLLCYFPEEDKWCRLCEIPAKYRRFNKFFPCEGKLYSSTGVQLSSDMVRYRPHTNSWMRLPSLKVGKYLWKMFLGNDDKMYALLSDSCVSCRYIRGLIVPCGREHSLFIWKYKPKLHMWEYILSLDHLNLNLRKHFCIVASDHFIYCIGGQQVGVQTMPVYLNSVERCDFSNSQWDKVADIQVARCFAFGAAVNGKIFIVGGFNKGLWVNECEMYDERMNEWHFIASLKLRTLDSLLAADGKLYALGWEVPCPVECPLQKLSVECYNPEKNEWEVKTEMAFPVKRRTKATNSFSMRIFKGLSSNLCPLETSTPESLSAAANSHTGEKK